MPIQTLVTFDPSTIVSKVRFENHEILDVLGKREEAIAVQFKELLASVTEAVQEAIEQEEELSIEISGSLDLKVAGGVQYLFFNVGSEAGKTNTMKVNFTTKITPNATKKD